MVDVELKSKIEELFNAISDAGHDESLANTDAYVSLESIPIERDRIHIEDEFKQFRSALLYDIEQTVFHEDGSIDINMRRCPCCGSEIGIDAIDDFSFVGCRFVIILYGLIDTKI